MTLRSRVNKNRLVSKRHDVSKLGLMNDAEISRILSMRWNRNITRASVYMLRRSAEYKLSKLLAGVFEEMNSVH